MYASRRTIVLTTTVLVAIAKTSISSYKIYKTNHKKHLEEIEAERLRMLAAIQQSAEIVNEKIRRGDYDRNMNVAEVFSDFEFYKIAAYEEQ